MNTRKVSGPVRDLSPREIGLWPKDRHGLTVVRPASSTREKAEEALDQAARAYTRDTWPGGCITDRLLVHWNDFDTWSGVFETYYSFS